MEQKQAAAFWSCKKINLLVRGYGYFVFFFFFFFLSLSPLIGWQLSIWNCCKPFFPIL
jgi:hypothetical protein